jgi:hypothetical protein
MQYLSWPVLTFALAGVLACGREDGTAGGSPRLAGPDVVRRPWLGPGYGQARARELVRGARTAAGQCEWPELDLSDLQLRPGERRVYWLAEQDTARCLGVVAWTDERPTHPPPGLRTPPAGGSGSQTHYQTHTSAASAFAPRAAPDSAPAAQPRSARPPR